MADMSRKLTLGLLVRDYDEAVDFYIRKLGFVVAEDVTMEGERWVTVQLPGSRDTLIAFHEAQNPDNLALVGKQGGSFPFFGIETGDCLGEYQRMKALGVKFHGEPDVQPYGTGVLLEDLYGNGIYLNQEPGGGE